MEETTTTPGCSCKNEPKEDPKKKPFYLTIRFRVLIVSLLGVFGLALYLFPTAIFPLLNTNDDGANFAGLVLIAILFIFLPSILVWLFKKGFKK